MSDNETTATHPAQGGSLTDWLDRQYERQLDRMVEQIHDIARRVRHNGTPRPPLSGRDAEKLNHVAAAASAISAIHNGLANLSVSGILDAARDADVLPLTEPTA